MAAGFNCHSVTQLSLTDPARNRERMTGHPEVETGLSALATVRRNQ
jgi:hypothetical protein